MTKYREILHLKSLVFNVNRLCGCSSTTTSSRMSGNTMPPCTSIVNFDLFTGETIPTFLFVGVMTYSQHHYAEAFINEK